MVRVGRGSARAGWLAPRAVQGRSLPHRNTKDPLKIQTDLLLPRQNATAVQAKTWSEFSVVYGPKGHESIAQGSPWVISPHRIGPEGATRYGENRLRTFEPNYARISSPFRAKRLFWLTQGKPWVNPGLSFLALRGGAFGPYNRR